MHIRNAKGIILVLLSASILFVVMLEIGLRIAGYCYSPLHIERLNRGDWRMLHAFEDHHFSYDPYLIWAPKVNHSVFNSQGFRGKVLEHNKGPDEIRIFAIGDSNTLGFDGKDTPNWPMYLSQQLVRDNKDIVVINAGVWGYSSFQGYRRFVQILPFRPDVILVSFGGNDPLQTAISDTEFLQTRFYKRMKLDRFLIRLKTGQLFIQLCDRVKPYKGRKLVPRVSAIEYKENLNKIIALARANNIKVVLLTRTFLGTSDDLFYQNYAAHYYEATKEVASLNKIPIIDLTSPFLYKEEFFSDQAHFNEEGYRRAAAIIYSAVKALIVNDEINENSSNYS